MRIGLDVRILSVSENRTGVPNYVHSLANHLMATSDIEAILFTDRPAPGHNRLVHPLFPGLPWQQSALPVAAMKSKIDVFHGPAYSLPVWGKFKKVVTIHDLGFVKHSEWTDDNVSRYLRSVVPLATRVADSIIVPTEEIHTDLMELYPKLTASKKIIVIPMGSTFADHKNSFNCPSEADTQRPYILHVGTLEPRKNLETLVSAFGIASQETKFPHKLVLIGSKGWKIEKLEETISNSPAKDRIIIRGFVGDQELMHWYRRASIYIQPSHYEGFGMATLDAYCMGLPILSTKTGWVAEISDTSVRFIEDARNANEMAFMIADMLKRPHVPLQRNREQWSWQETMRKHYALYKAVLGV